MDRTARGCDDSETGASSSGSTTATNSAASSSDSTDSPPTECSSSLHRPSLTSIIAAVRSSNSTAVAAWRLHAEKRRERIASAVSACVHEAPAGACEFVTTQFPLREAEQLGKLSAAESVAVMSCTWPQSRVVLRVRHEGAAAIVLKQRCLGLLSPDDLLLLSPSAGFRGGFDSVGERHDVLGLDASRPTVGDIAASNAGQFARWEIAASQRRARVSDLLDDFFAQWSSRFSAAVVTVQLLPSEAEALSIMSDDARVRCLRCLWPLVRISIPQSHAAQSTAARVLLATLGVPASDADVVIDHVVELGGPGFALASAGGPGLSTVGACVSARSVPAHAVLSSGHGCTCSQSALLHDPRAWAPCCAPPAECIAFVDPSLAESGPLPFLDASFPATWVDLTLSRRRFLTVADVGVYSTASLPTSAVGVHYSLLDSSKVLWGCQGRHYGYSSLEATGSFAARGVFDFVVTGAAYRLAGFGSGGEAPTVFSRSAAPVEGGRFTADFRTPGASPLVMGPPVVGDEITPLLLDPVPPRESAASAALGAAFTARGSTVEVLFHVTKSSDAEPGSPWARPGDSGASATCGQGDDECLFGLVKGRSFSSPQEGFVVPASVAIAQVSNATSR